MADSNSLLLLPPRHTAQSAAAPNAKKTNKPTQGESFGKKLDKAKTQIVVGKVAPAAPAKVADEKDAATAPKSTDPQTAEDADPTKDPITPTADKKAVKLPKTVAAKPADSSKDEEADEDSQLATKPVTAAESAVDKPKKPTAHSEKKIATAPIAKKSDGAKAAAVQPVAPKKPDTTAASTAAAAQSAVQPSASASSDAADADSDVNSDSTDSIAPTDSPFYGSAKIVTQNSSASQSANASAASADNDPSASPDATTETAVATAAEDTAAIDEPTPVKAEAEADTHSAGVATDVSGLTSPTTSSTPTTVAAKAAAHAASPQVQFTEDNHPKIITGIAGQLMPRGGTMQLQLNPAELGALQVTVHLQDGVMTASFQTSNEDATKLLSHSLGQLKTGLEAAGVSVEKLHVEQAPQQDFKNDSESDGKSSMQEQQKNAQQDQQRREMVQKMWRRLAGGSDPLDLVA